MAQNVNSNGVFYATTYHPIQAGSIDGTDTAPHDNAVYRALLASATGLYDPTGDQKAEGDPYTTLFVGRLAQHTSEATIYEAMSKFGRVKHLRLVRHIVTGASQGYAFVEFETDKDMLYAYEAAHHNIIDGSQILVDYSRQQLMPGWIPRRLGGGLGGCKESGQLRFGGRDRPFRAPLRPIPTDQLIKLGIPLPPVGRYFTRFQLPPAPRRGESPKDHYKHRSSHRQSDVRERSPETSGADRRDEIQKGSGLSRATERSSCLDKRTASRSSHLKEHRSRQPEEDGEEYVSRKRLRGHDDERSLKEKKGSEAGSAKGHYVAGGSHRDRDRSRSRSVYEDRENTDHDVRSPIYGHESRGRDREYDRSSRYGYEGTERKRSGSKHRRRES